MVGAWKYAQNELVSARDILLILSVMIKYQSLKRSS